MARAAALRARRSADGEDIRDRRESEPGLYDPQSYARSHIFGETIRARGGDGIAYDSVRRHGCSNAVAFKPRNVRDVTLDARAELTVPTTGRIVCRRL